MIRLNSVKFFLGANTPDGFYSLFNELYDPYKDWRMYIIKGGPGTGKSTIMKAVADEAESNNYFVERIPCSSDPESLDGVIIPQLKVSVADGTSPHVINPIFPGVCEHIVDPGSCWNTDKLSENTSKIKMMTMTNSAAHKKCIKYMKAATLIENEIDKYTEPAVITEKIDRFVKRLSDTYFNLSDDNFTVKNRFLSALSPSGVTIMDKTIDYYCDNTIIIKDLHNISHKIIKKIAEEALNKKINTILCRCPMNPANKIEHIIFPDSRLGILTSNSYHAFKGSKNITTSRFIDKNSISRNKNSIMFLKKAKSELIAEAIECLKSAKSAHDILESYYIEAMDFNKVNNIKNNLICRIFN